MEMTMTDQEQKAITTLVLMAAFADGKSDATERAHVSKVAESLSQGGELNVAAIYQDVLLERVTLADTVAQLATPQVKRLAYELCVGACEADGSTNDNERRFLTDLQSRLGLEPAQAAEVNTLTAHADALAVAPLATVTASEPATLSSTMSAEEQDRVILNYAILNGALELLPDSLATMAIIPLQMKMVYRIGKTYGFELDRGHIKDLLATAGIGMTSQYVEQVGRKIIGRLFGGGLLGGVLGGAAKQAVSSGFSFASTYALGRLAVRYYSGGRTFSTQVLKDTYVQLLEEAKGLQGKHMPEIREKARTVNVSQILQDVRA
jgi:uncharacterized protein (DUF697 family)/tellurite resistance protein